jgi:CBS domain-containing protein
MTVAEEAEELLCRTQPFSALPAETLQKLTNDIAVASYPAGHIIIRQGGPAAEHLSVIKSGRVKVFLTTNEKEDVLLDHRGPGGTFGILSLMRGDRAIVTIRATEDTTSYLIAKEAVLRLMAQHASFSEFFLRFYMTRLVDLMQREMQERSLLYGGGDKMLFTHRLDELSAGKIVRARSDITIRQAAEQMARNRISSLLLTDESGFPAGIVTDRDLRDRVVAAGKDVNDRVSNIMSVTLIKSDAKDFCFEALLKMIRFNIHHLLVADRGELVGIITNHDLMMLQSTYPLAIARDIEHQRSIEGLAVAQHAIDRLIAVLVREGARASTITRIITEVNDRLVRRLLEIIEDRLGPPPVAYCWIAFGSEGRKEQTFRTDQDNAIIFNDTPPGEEERVERYFAALADAMQKALTDCGFPPCPAGYMASTARWRRSLTAWKEAFRQWIRTPTPEAVLLSLIFFDFRPVHGDPLLAENLRASLIHSLKGGSLFLTHMAAIALQNRSPLGLFGRLNVERTGPHRGTLNIKINGLAPIVDAARMAALESHVYATSTLERLRDIQGTGSFLAPPAPDIEQAFEFLMGLRLQHQYRQRRDGAEADNHIDPVALSHLEWRMLRETFRLIGSVQYSIREHFHTGLVS